MLLATAPVYFVTNYLLYQDAAIRAFTVVVVVFCLYILRGWWVPDRALGTIRFRLRRHAAMTEEQPEFLTLAGNAGIVFLPRKQQAASVEGTALWSRILTDIYDKIWLKPPAAVQIQRPVPARHPADPSSSERTTEHPKSQEVGAASASGVSLVITQAQKTRLRERGFADEEIRNMLPVDAHNILGLKSSVTKAAIVERSTSRQSRVSDGTKNRGAA
jgi:hypothetical protein